MVKWKCRKCGTEFEAESTYTDLETRERVDPKCPSCNSYAVKPITE